MRVGHGAHADRVGGRVDAGQLSGTQHRHGGRWTADVALVGVHQRVETAVAVVGDRLQRGEGQAVVDGEVEVLGLQAIEAVGVHRAAAFVVRRIGLIAARRRQRVAAVVDGADGHVGLGGDAGPAGAGIDEVLVVVVLPVEEQRRVGRLGEERAQADAHAERVERQRRLVEELVPVEAVLLGVLHAGPQEQPVGDQRHVQDALGADLLLVEAERRETVPLEVLVGQVVDDVQHAADGVAAEHRPLRAAVELDLSGVELVDARERAAAEARCDAGAVAQLQDRRFGVGVGRDAGAAGLVLGQVLVVDREAGQQVAELQRIDDSADFAEDVLGDHGDGAGDVLERLLALARAHHHLVETGCVGAARGLRCGGAREADRGGGDEGGREVQRALGAHGSPSGIGVIFLM